MQSRMKLLNAAAFVAFQFAFVSSASALEAQPGDACPVVGRYTLSGGPELSGVTHQMVCNASNVWSSVLDNDAAGNVSLAHAVSLTGDISPSQITANQNDYNPVGLSTASVLRVNSNASRNITSLAGGADGRIVTVMNIGSFPIVLKNDDGATGTAANRFAFTGDLTLAAKQSAMLMYDSTASRWRQIANGTATGSGDNLGNHTATQNILLGSNYISNDGDSEGLSIDSSGRVSITGTSAGPVSTLDVTASIDGGAEVAVRNWNSGTGAYSQFLVTNDVGAGSLALAGSNYPYLANVFELSSFSTTNGIRIATYGSTSTTAPISIATNDTEIAKFDLTGFNNKASFALSGDISPAQITANQNDYNPTDLATASVLRLSSDASRDITGLSGGADGRVMTLFNVGSTPLVVKNQSTSSTAGNRFALGADMTLAADQSITIMYDATSQRWRAAGLPFSSAGGCTVTWDTPGDIINVAQSTIIESDIKLVSTSGCTPSVGVGGDGSPEFRICSDSTCTTVTRAYSSSAGTISSGAYVQARLTSGSSYGQTETSTLTIGSAATDWAVTTANVPEYIDKTTFSASWPTPTNSSTINKPVATQQDDLMLAVMALNDTTTITPPVGWTTLRSSTVTSSDKLGIFYKIAGSSEPSSYSFDFGSNEYRVGSIVTIRNVNSTTPINVNATSTGSSASPTAPSITTTVSNALIVAVSDITWGVTYTPPSGYTERVDASISSAESISVATKLQSASGATGTAAFTTTTSDSWRTEHIAIQAP